jgi:hypothetical protein
MMNSAEDVIDFLFAVAIGYYDGIDPSGDLAMQKLKKTREVKDRIVAKGGVEKFAELVQLGMPQKPDLHVIEGGAKDEERDE